jgi:type IV pilus assembly protein PilC
MSNFTGNIYSLIGDPAQKDDQSPSRDLFAARSKPVKVKKRDLIFILRNVSILVENGLALPKALATLFEEKALRKYASMLRDIQQRVESGEAFSDALAHYPQSFNDLLVSQLRIGERSGTIPETLARLVHQLEHADNLRSKIVKKLAYPTLLIVAGSGAVSFMVLYVVPTFQTVYKESGATLPAVTQLLIDVSQFCTHYGWILLLAAVGAIFAVAAVRRNPVGRLRMDAWLLRLPLFGKWFQNLALLQFIEVLGNLMDAGFTVVDALKASAAAVNNRWVRQCIEDIHDAVTQGEQFSAELARHGELFPPVVNQLVIVGEKTGTLPKTTIHIREHLRREVENYTNVMVGTIEPVTTIGLASAIGVILLAIYLPMFDLINAMN